MAAKKKTQAAKTSVARGRGKEPTGRIQVSAIILFAVAILTLCLALIPGENVWNFLHNALRGIFGICVFLVPLVLGYTAYCMTAKEERRVAWQGSILILSVCSALQIFLSDIGAFSYFEAFRESFLSGVELRSGGAIGVLLGYPLEYALGDVGAKIVILLLAFVAIMLLTRTTLQTFFRTIGKPVQKTRETIQTAMADRNERQQERKKSIDIEMGDGYRTPETDLQAANDAVDRELSEMTGKKNNKLDSFTQAAQGLYDDKPEPKRDDRVGKAARGAAEEKSAEAETEEQPDEAETPAYRYPPISLLDQPKAGSVGDAEQERRQTAELLVKTLKEFNVDARVVGISRGPAVTRYELEPSAGVKISRITGLSDDIALRLATTGVRIEAPIPNKAAVGIEVPNKARQGVGLRELIDSSDFLTAESKLTVALGKDISGHIVLTDLAKMPHLLIAGTTGSGKSVCTNSMILSVLYRASPEDVKMVLIDPKKVEFTAYNGIPHLLVPVVTDPRKAAGALGWAVTEMLRRYQVFSENRVRDLGDYNKLARTRDDLPTMPQILIVIDELSDLMMSAANEVEDAIVRLAQMARAAGMHLVIATQRPSVDVITGLIKSNIPSRLSLTVASAVDSRTILDAAGADKLLGRGDMLFMPIGTSKPMRIQGCFVSAQEIQKVVEFLQPEEEQQYDESVLQEIERQAAAAAAGGSRSSGGDDDEDGEADEMLPRAIETVIEAGEASTSLLQRKLRLGYARAGRLIDDMERRGIVGPHEGSKPRQVLITRQQWLEMNTTGSMEE
ncbi:MAG: DNA translocase FtsK 4TM domain-containing protein [Clostridia bacterium]|nr:DNA translocase FtsK 4TM domain-containing protein [Clostridia bacterium]